jgi:hypothetical protein
MAKKVPTSHCESADESEVQGVVLGQEFNRFCVTVEQDYSVYPCDLYTSYILFAANICN